MDNWILVGVSEMRCPALTMHEKEGSRPARIGGGGYRTSMLAAMMWLQDHDEAIAPCTMRLLLLHNVAIAPS